MGYYTYYNLEVRDLNTKELISEALEAEITRKIAVILGLEDNKDTTFEDLLFDELKWYDYDEDMQDLSKEYPDCVFILQGEGEDREDLWRNYYCRGFAWGRKCRDRVSRDHDRRSINEDQAKAERDSRDWDLMSQFLF